MLSSKQQVRQNQRGTNTEKVDTAAIAGGATDLTLVLPFPQ